MCPLWKQIQNDWRLCKKENQEKKAKSEKTTIIKFLSGDMEWLELYLFLETLLWIFQEKNDQKVIAKNQKKY